MASAHTNKQIKYALVIAIKLIKRVDKEAKIKSQTWFLEAI